MQKCFFIKANGRFVKIHFQDILYVEGCKNYSKIVTEARSYLVLITMKRLDQLLLSHLFLRIHKSFIVSIERILEFEPDRVYLKGKELPIGQQYRGELEKAVTIVYETNNQIMPLKSFNMVPLLLNGNSKNIFLGAG